MSLTNPNEFYPSVVSPVCALCCLLQLIIRIFAKCQVAPAQGRYNWHHNSALKIWVKDLQRDSLPSDGYTLMLISLVTSQV